MVNNLKNSFWFCAKTLFASERGFLQLIVIFPDFLQQALIQKQILYQFMTELPRPTFLNKPKKISLSSLAESDNQL